MLSLVFVYVLQFGLLVFMSCVKEKKKKEKKTTKYITDDVEISSDNSDEKQSDK